MSSAALRLSPGGLELARQSVAILDCLIRGLAKNAPAVREVDPLLCLIRNAIASAEVDDATCSARPRLRLVK